MTPPAVSSRTTVPTDTGEGGGGLGEGGEGGGGEGGGEGGDGGGDTGEGGGEGGGGEGGGLGGKDGVGPMGGGTRLSEYGPYSEASVTTLRVPSLLVAPVQGEEEHGPPPGTVLVSVRKEGNTPPCMKPLVIRLAVPVHRASSEVARRYALGGGGGDNGGDGGEDGGGDRSAVPPLHTAR